MENISQLDNEDFLRKVAKEISQACFDLSTKETVDYSFETTQGKMLEEKTNTTFSFDIPVEYENAHKYKKILFDQDLTAEEEAKAIELNKKVASYIEKEYLDGIRKTARKIVLADGSPILFPMQNIKITDIEVLDLENMEQYAKCHLKVMKLSRPGSLKAGTDAVAVELINIHAETGKDVNEIIKEKKASNDPRYDSVCYAEWTKYLFECDIRAFIDYAPVEKEELLKDENKSAN